MKKLFVLGMLTLLSGCYQSIDQYDLRRAIAKCGSIENVSRITASAGGLETYRCFDMDKEENL